MAPLTVGFSGSASGGTGSYTYYWDFGDNTMTTGQSVQHVYSVYGDYTAVLTVEDSSTATATDTLLVSVSMGITISATPSSGLAPLGVALDGSATGGTAPYDYAWDFGDGSTAGPLPAAAQSHIYSIPGSYAAKLTVTDAKLVTATDTVVITAEQPVPTVGGVSPPAGPESGGTQVTITGTYLWNLSAVTFGSTAVTGTLPTPTCDAAGYCSVTVTSPPRRAGTVEVRVTTPGGQSPVGTDQFTYFLSWSLVEAATTAQTSTQPAPREGAILVTDGTGVLLFGGSNGTALLNDTWRWNGTGWRLLNPTLAPPVRANAAAAFNGSKVVLFGGACGLPANSSTCQLNDTWSWDPAAQTWTQVQANTTAPGTGQPSQRVGPMLAKDNSGKLLLFGGSSAGTYKADSWSFTGSAWTLQTTTTAPAGRAFAAMASDNSGQVVLFGGYNSTTGILGDTWIWYQGAWSQPNTQGVAPAGRKMAAMSNYYHPNGGTATGLALFGGHDATTDLGDTWTWNGYSWVPLYGPGPGQPPLRSDAMAAMDSNGSVVMFGGSSTGTQANDLWRLS